MKPTIRFVSRWDFKKLLGYNQIDDNTAVISISDTDSERKEMEQVIAFSNFDADRAFFTNFPDNDVGIPPYNAMKLVEFIKNQGNINYVVHCFMGVSRSGAVAKFINEYFGMEDTILEDYLNYNRQVYNSLNAVIGQDLATYYAELELKDRPKFSG